MITYSIAICTVQVAGKWREKYLKVHAKLKKLRQSDDTTEVRPRTSSLSSSTSDDRGEFFSVREGKKWEMFLIGRDFHLPGWGRFKEYVSTANLMYYFF